MKVGFIGLGQMGAPMAGQLLRGGVALQVWNRTAEKCAPLVARGAVQAADPDALFASSEVVLLMLRGEAAIDAVLGRRTPDFVHRVAGRCIVLLGTTSPAWSLDLEQDIVVCGGRYVEAPVSGSRVPAEQARLVGMAAGHPAVVDTLLPLLGMMCRKVFRCGLVPNALRLKLAVNHYLIATVTALAETVHAADAAGVDLRLLRHVLDGGPMASDTSRGKLEKLVAADYSAQASIDDVANIATLVADQARRAGVQAPLIERSRALFASALAAGDGALDMCAVRRAFDRPTPAPIELRPLQTEDSLPTRDLILRIVNDEYHMALTLAELPDIVDLHRTYVASGLGQFWVATRDGRVVGCIGVLRLNPRCHELRRMYVDPAARGHRIAQRLLDRALGWCVANDVEELLLETNTAWQAAQHIYVKNGFEPVTRDALPPEFPVVRVATNFYRLRLRPAQPLHAAHHETLA